ncbi:MAG TPA: isoprenylcysteine carboxylmethyltransferase family protein, partial [Gemmatimonadales bacterium]|nr:isoprenylcysteine carboxylmethyltransferase family protein [Gemmatimonadales bacterium]
IQRRPSVPPPSRDSSGVRVFPPGIYAGVFLAAYLVHRLWPVRLWRDLPFAVRLLSYTLLGAAVLLVGTAALLFRRAGTTPNPTRPTTALVVRGPYRVTRNPMYLGLASLYLGVALLVNSVWPCVAFPVAILLIDRFVIAREELYLEQKFGDAYRAYRGQVRRWL